MNYLPKMKLAFVTVLAIAGFTINPAPGWTQTNLQVIANLPLAKMPLPPGTGSPDDQQTPGGSRGGACKQTDKRLSALVPKKADESLTTADNPVFWFYIPDAFEDIYSIEFSLHDLNDTTTLYRASLQVTKTPAVIGIPLPLSPNYSLKLNESYRWKLIVNCTAQAKPEDVIALEGLVTRVQRSPNLLGVIWYDELTNRAKQYLLEPQNPVVRKTWAELLKSVGLEELAQAPLVSALTNPSQP
jgi:hypothetical protein